MTATYQHFQELELIRLKNKLRMLEADIEKTRQKIISIESGAFDYILEHVCDTLKVSIDAVQGRRRFRELVEARIVFAAIASEKGYTLSGTGRLIDRDHSSIIHYLQTHEVWKKNYEGYAQRYSLIKKGIDDLIIG